MNALILAASQPPVDSGDVGVGIIYLVVIAVVAWVIFGKHDDGKRD